MWASCHSDDPFLCQFTKFFCFVLTGLGQVQLKLGDFRSSLSNFEKVLEVYPENCETLKVSFRKRYVFYSVLILNVIPIFIY